MSFPLSKEALHVLNNVWKWNFPKKFKTLLESFITNSTSWIFQTKQQSKYTFLCWQIFTIWIIQRKICFKSEEEKSDLDYFVFDGGYLYKHIINAATAA